jgi:hypothetical protein
VGTGLRYGVTLAATALAALAIAPGTAAAAPPEDTVWLCKPGTQPNPCEGGLDTTVFSPDGQSSVETPKQSKRKIDCFYVYPTVSEQQGPNADLTIEPAQIAVAQQQAARFSQHCRVFAPMYNQLTISSLSRPPEELVGPGQIAYGSVVSAWRDYLRHYNKGRGVVLIGHSQGTGMLRLLIRNEIDPRRSLRKRLVAALLLGLNVTVKRDSVVGGDFQHVPACTAPKQFGCVVAYSTFNETPPDNTLFGKPGGRLGEALGFPTGPEYEVLCTNPAALAGGSAELETLVNSAPVPGLIGAGLSIMYGGPQPSAATSWIRPQDHYTGECVESNGANVLMISPVGSARRLNPSPDATWGLHLADVNIALGNLVDYVGRAGKRYLKKQDAKK